MHRIPKSVRVPPQAADLRRSRTAAKSEHPPAQRLPEKGENRIEPPPAKLAPPQVELLSQSTAPPYLGQLPQTQLEPAQSATVQAKSWLPFRGGQGQKLSDAAVHQTAARGIAGPNVALPYLSIIQRSFGRHGISGIRAHLDEAATASAQKLGASGFAMGQHVAFAGQPDLHTAAHEAAHVVQQRGGVHLSAVGQAGDRHEQHADAVAARVVNGQSSEALLDSYCRQDAPQSAAGVVTQAKAESARPAAPSPLPVVQLKDIKTKAKAVVGTYDSVGAYESDYKSTWDAAANKNFGVSYYLVNAKDASKVALPTAVTHAHVSGNGTVVDGISVKDAPGGGGAQVVSPADISDETAGALRGEMNAHALKPQYINNRRMVSRETGNWLPNSQPGDGDFDKSTGYDKKTKKDGKGNKAHIVQEQVYFSDGDNWTSSATKTANNLYDANTGVRVSHVYKTENQAQAAIEDADKVGKKLPAPTWANGT